MPHQNPPIPAPPTDRPAGELRYLDLALRATRRHVRGIALGAVVMWLLAALAFGLGGMPLTTVSITVLAVLFSLLALAQYAAVGRWLRAAPRLFATEPWRPVDVRAVRRDSRATVLELTESSGAEVHVRLTAAVDLLRHAVGRAERLWLAGPDEHGWVAVHLAGVRAPLPGRIVPEARRRSDLPPMAISAFDPAAPASADVVTAGTARALLRYSRQLYVPAKTLLAIGLGVLIPALWIKQYALLVISAVAFAAAVPVFLSARKRLGDWPKLLRLLDAGPWQRVPAELDPLWQPGGRGFADGKATLTLPTGENLAVRLPMLGFDVAEYVRNTGTVWIAGEPGPSFAIGVPGSPILAVAHQLQSGPRRAQLHA
ncbi:hypothetical protein [Allokutzneria oryzae]|uniref:DUF2207 domain-containing protein n=1 Tax=Allokutzneria oryzae TaxID=1378989 RepID=A0ABV5ZZZ8_9PSEU